MAPSQIKKLAELRNLSVLKISLVDAGANKKELIYKAGYDNVDQKILIKKIDEEKKLVYCIVYSPNQEDSHGHFASASTIEKACHDFSKRSIMHSVDKQHDLEDLPGVYIAESWIVKEDCALFPGEVGAWAVCIKVEDNEEVWKQIKDGDIKGVSMYGFAKIVEKSNFKFSELKDKVVKFFDELSDTEYVDEMETDKIIKDFNESYAKMDLQNVVSAMNCAMYDIIWSDGYQSMTKDEQIAALMTSAEQFKTKLAEIETAASMVAKAGKKISDANMKMLKDAYVSIKSVIDAAEKIEKIKKSLLEKFKPNEENKMTKEEIEKAATDAADIAVKKAIEPLNTEIETLKSDKEKLEKENDALKKQTKGSNQEEVPGGVKKVKKGMFVAVPVTE